MCGRYAFAYDLEEFKERFDLNDVPEDFASRYNIAPGSHALIITKNSPKKASPAIFGLLPPWAKDMKILFRFINARSETITEKPVYKRPFLKQRCLIPFSAFYEWKQIDKKTKQPYLFHDTKEKMLSFAGIYEIAHDGDGKEIRSFSIITTSANKSMHGIHDRMPVILDRDQEEVWLDKEASEKDLLELLDGYKSKAWECYPVSDEVGKATNDNPSLLKKVDPKPEARNLI
jgi:putative SOS response-associated peptidase YedK